MDEDQSLDAITEGEDEFSEGDENVESQAATSGKEETEAELLTRINAEVGTNYKTLEEAIKGFKNTKKFVGKPKEAAPAQTDNTIVREIETLKEQIFLKDNVLAKDHIEQVKAIAKVNEVSLDEAWSGLKDLAEAKAKLDETRRGASVIESNPKLAARKNESQEAFNKALAEGTEKSWARYLSKMNPKPNSKNE